MSLVDMSNVMSRMHQILEEHPRMTKENALKLAHKEFRQTEGKRIKVVQIKRKEGLQDKTVIKKEVQKPIPKKEISKEEAILEIPRPAPRQVPSALRKVPPITGIKK